MEKVTPLILTYNEEANIGRCLASLNWAKQLVVIDSMSTDSTISILSKFNNVRVLQRTFNGHADQWNYGLQQIETEWVLSLDADYIVQPDLFEEIMNLSDESVDGYWTDFRYCIFGKQLHASLMPPRLSLFKKNKAIYFQEGHTQMLKLCGKTGYLKSKMLHDDRKSIDRFVQSQINYSKLERTFMGNQKWNEKNTADKVRHFYLISPFICFFYYFLFRGGVFDGKAGVFYAFQRFVAELICSLYKLENSFVLKKENDRMAKKTQQEKDHSNVDFEARKR